MKNDMGESARIARVFLNLVSSFSMKKQRSVAAYSLNVTSQPIIPFLKSDCA